MIYLIALLIGLGIIVGLFTLLTNKQDDEQIVVKTDDCTTCDGIDPKCEQVCTMEAATKEIEYFDDEELDQYEGRPSDDFTDDEAEVFRDVLYTMRQEEVSRWNRSLILRGINLPNQLKDEVIMLIRQTSVVLVCMILAACSTSKNTAKSRWWHSFAAKYNTYYNGTLAYIDGSLTKESGNKDNFTEMIPLYTVGNKNSKTLGASNFEQAIEKSEKAIRRHSIKQRPEWNKNRKKTAQDIEWLSRREYNPFLWKAWLLLGRSQFMKGDFEEAASTFSYMSRLYQSQPAIYGKARAWLAKSYIELDWIYDAEDVMNKMKRDSMDWRAAKEWDYTYADYYLHTKQLEEAIPYLHKVIKHEMRRKQKAREWYLLGQVYAALGQKDEAYKAYKHVVKLNPPYEVAFNARIAMTEVMAEGRSRQMISKLRRMAASDNNQEFLDQVYYAIGNIYLTQKDTLNAIAAYEKGNEKAVRAGIEKGVLLLHLGDLYWQKEKFGDANRCYGEAIGLLDKDRDDYEELSRRSKILEELAPHTEAIHLQDSLQALAKMSEKDRNAAIDRVIDELKRKEKEERDRLAEANAQQQLSRNGGTNMTTRQAAPTQPTAGNQQQSSTWYFYNPLAVSQGKSTFQRQWGKRENQDNWQRINKTVVNMGSDGTESADGTGSTDNTQDSEGTGNAEGLTGTAANDSVKGKADTDSAALDPHRREYYLAQIPFTEEQVQASNLIIMEALYNAGVIFKDKLDNLRLSERHLRRLTDQYADYDHMDNAYYHLYLLCARKGDMAQANAWLTRLQQQYEESQWTKLLSDPHYAENARWGEQLEDSLYGRTYDAFKTDQYHEVLSNVRISADRFPEGANRDKFIFIGGLTKLNSGDSDGCVADMKEVVEKFPSGRISEMAGMIINGVKAGKRLHGGRFDMNDVWSRRAVVMNDSDSISARQLVDDRDIPFVFIIAYEPDSLNENQLLFQLARYNFTNFLVRNFELQIEDADGLHRMLVNGFTNYDEALQYARMLFQQERLRQFFAHCRTIIISQQNLELLGNQFSYNDYDSFYDEHFAPMKISEDMLLLDPAEILYEEQPEMMNPRLPELKETTPPDSPQKTQSAEGMETLTEQPQIIDKAANIPQATQSKKNDAKTEDAKKKAEPKKPEPKKAEPKKAEPKKPVVPEVIDEYYELEGF